MKGGNISYKNNGDAIYVGSFLTVHNPLFWCNGGHSGIFITVTHTNNVNREIKIHVLRQTADVNLYHVTKFSTYSPFSLYCFYTKISSFMPDITIGIVRDCFYLLIFYSEKFST